MRWIVILVWTIFFLMGAQSFAQTTDTGGCSEGCIPISEVKELQGDGTITRSKCAAGCIAIEEVKTVHTPDADTGTVDASARSAAKSPDTVSNQTAGEAPAEVPAEALERLVDGRLSQMVLQPTALGLKKKQVVISGVGAGFWQAEIGVSDHFSISAYTVVPAIIAGFGAKVKVHTRLGKNAAISLSAMGVIGGPYIDGGGVFMVAEVVQPTVSVFAADKKHLLNFSLAVGGMQYCEKANLWSYDSGTDNSGYECESMGKLLLAPRVGYRAAVHRRVALQLEWLMPLATDVEVKENGHMHLISYSIQVHGDLLFSDLGFLLPIWAGVSAEIFQFFPIGIPYFTIGFKI